MMWPTRLRYGPVWTQHMLRLSTSMSGKRHLSSLSIAMLAARAISTSVTPGLSTSSAA